jgi:hypothetical protein
LTAQLGQVPGLTGLIAVFHPTSVEKCVVTLVAGAAEAGTAITKLTARTAADPAPRTLLLMLILMIVIPPVGRLTGGLGFG